MRKQGNAQPACIHLFAKPSPDIGLCENRVDRIRCALDQAFDFGDQCVHIVYLGRAAAAQLIGIRQDLECLARRGLLHRGDLPIQYHSGRAQQ